MMLLIKVWRFRRLVVYFLDFRDQLECQSTGVAAVRSLLVEHLISYTRSFKKGFYPGLYKE